MGAPHLNNVLAAIERDVAGADIAIMLDIDGYVAEGPGYNIMMAKDGVIYTPTTRNALPGVTLAALIELARRDGYTVIETDRMEVFDLCTADEFWTTSSMLFMLPVTEIDGRKIGDGKAGPIMMRLRQLLVEEMDKEVERFFG